MDGGMLAFILIASIGTLVILILACICCPICIIAKLIGNRRRQGVVYETPANDNGNTTSQIVTHGRRQIVVNVRHQGPRGNQATSTPANYPVQPQAPAPAGQGPQMQYPQYPHYGGTPGAYHGGYPPAPSPAGYQVHNQGLPDLPPPYPGLPRDNDAFQAQPAFNPHFDEHMENLIAVASRTPGAPPSSKQ